MSNLEIVPDYSNDLPAFLDYLYGGLEGYVAAATKRVKDDGSVEFHRESFQWPLAKDILADWIKNNAPHKDVYVAPAIFSESSGKREHFKATNVVWAEFDGALPSDEQRGSIPLPNLTVQSSSDENQHWYWRLSEPLTDSTQVESINRALTYQLGADSSGWDANQILRPPSTLNHKRDKPVFVISRNDDSVSPVLFDVLPAVEQAVVDVPSEAIPDATDVIFKYQFSSEVIELFRTKDAPVGARSSMMMRLGYFLAEMGLSDVEMFALLRNADDRWGKFKDRTDRAKRLSDLIGKARQKFPEEVQLPEDVVPIYGLLSFLNTDVEIEWVLPGLLQEQGYMLLTGPSGVGKTQFSLRWAINIALGRDYLGYEISRPRKVMVWSLEMGHPDLKFFLSTMCEHMTQEELLLLEQNLLIVPLGEAFYLDMAKTQEQFRTIVGQFEPEGLFIDSIGSSSSGAVTDESTVKALMDFNDSIRNEFGVFTWFIHHNRKAQGDNKKPNKLADVYGNQYLVNRATTVYCLWPASSSIEVIPLKKRLAAMEDPWAVSRLNNLDFQKKETNVSFKAKDNLIEEEVPVEKGFSEL